VGTADVSGQSTAGSDGESEKDIIGGLEAHEDDRALRLLDGPLTWQMCHVSVLTGLCQLVADSRRMNRYQSSPQEWLRSLMSSTG